MLMSTAKRSLPVLALLGLLAGCGESTPGTVSETGGAAANVEVGTRAASAPAYPATAFHHNVSLRMSPSRGYAISPDNARALLSSDITGIYNTLTVDLLSGEAVPLTSSDDDVRLAVSYFPADDRVLVTGDVGGNERYHLFVREADGTQVDLTPGSETRAAFFGWESGGAAFFVTSNARDPKAMDLYRVAVDDYDQELIFLNEAALTLQDLSEDGRWLAVLDVKSNTDSEILLLDLASDHVEPLVITDPAVAVSHSIYGFTPDSKALSYQLLIIDNPPCF